MVPSWFRGKEVVAEDFHRLEQYLLRRHAFEGPGYGVESFHLEESIQAELEGSLFRLTIRDVQGVTDKGQPVVVEDELTAEVRVAEPPFEFDLEIAVNPFGSALFEHFPEGPPKCILRLNGTPGDLEFGGGVLDLGSYSYRPELGLQCLHRPRVRRLNAIYPLDKVWDGWVQPWRGALEQRLNALKGCTPGATWRGVAWTQHLSALALRWPTMPLQELVAEAQFLRALADSDPGQPLEPIRHLAGLPGALEGDDVPRYLADLLGLRLRPLGLEAVAPVESDSPTAPQPDVKLKWLPPDTLLARFATSLDGKRVSLCIPRNCSPAETLEVRGGPAVGGFRVKEELSGERKGEHIVYPMRSTPREGETFRFSPVHKEAADGVYVTW
ncbi:hypothetical protein IV102_25605 [bacterium]|nr:hypothetical protein [bacterium]